MIIDSKNWYIMLADIFIITGWHVQTSYIWPSYEDFIKRVLYLSGMNVNTGVKSYSTDVYYSREDDTLNILFYGSSDEGVLFSLNKSDYFIILASDKELSEIEEIEDDYYL